MWGGYDDNLYGTVDIDDDSEAEEGGQQDNIGQQQIEEQPPQKVVSLMEVDDNTGLNQAATEKEGPAGENGKEKKDDEKPLEEGKKKEVSMESGEGAMKPSGEGNNTAKEAGKVDVAVDDNASSKGETPAEQIPAPATIPVVAQAVATPTISTHHQVPLPGLATTYNGPTPTSDFFAQNVKTPPAGVKFGLSRHKGVSYVPGSRIKPWKAQIYRDKKHHYLGCFATEEAAVEAIEKYKANDLAAKATTTTEKKDTMKASKPPAPKPVAAPKPPITMPAPTSMASGSGSGSSSSANGGDAAKASKSDNKPNMFAMPANKAPHPPSCTAEAETTSTTTTTTTTTVTMNSTPSTTTATTTAAPAKVEAKPEPPKPEPAKKKPSPGRYSDNTPKKSKYKGVCYNGGSNKRNPWQAFSYSNQRKEYLGSFPTEREAADAVESAEAGRPVVAPSTEGKKRASTSSDSSPSGSSGSDTKAKSSSEKKAGGEGKTPKSEYKGRQGVSYNGSANKKNPWNAYLHGKYLGCHPTPEAAAKAVEEAAAAQGDGDVADLGLGVEKAKGVFFSTGGSKIKPWVAQPYINGQRKYIGRYATEEEAKQAIEDDEKARQAQQGGFSGGTVVIGGRELRARPPPPTPKPVGEPAAKKPRISGEPSRKVAVEPPPLSESEMSDKDKLVALLVKEGFRPGLTKERKALIRKAFAAASRDDDIFINAVYNMTSCTDLQVDLSLPEHQANALDLLLGLYEE